MPREKRNVRPPQYYDPEVESSKPQWASPFSPFPTPPRQPVVYMTGNHVVPDVGLGTTVVAPPTSAVAAGGSAVAIPPPPPYPPPPMPVVAPRMPEVLPLMFPPTSAVAAGGSAVAAPTVVVAPEYWGNDENTVFVETLTDASRTSLRWEHEQLENTMMFSATGQGVRTIFHNGE